MSAGDLMIPASPVSGTADDKPLVTLADYQMLTNDTDTTSTAFDYFLADAIDMLQRKLCRTLLYGQYNERLYLYQDGLVYGSAVPYDTGKAVTNPSVDSGSSEQVGIFQGYGIWVGWYIPLPSLPIWQGVVPSQTDILYWGGFVGPDSSLASERPLPAGIKRILCKMVWLMANPVMLTSMPVTARSVSVGGVSSSGDSLESMVAVSPGLGREIRKWRHPMVRAFAGQVAGNVTV